MRSPILLILVAAVLSQPSSVLAQSPASCDIVFAKRAPRRLSFEAPVSFAPGGNLFLRARSGEVANLTGLTEGDVASPCVSYDGNRVMFAMRDTPRASWHLYEIELATRRLRQVSRGPGNDISPSYLPDGGIVFCSDRPGYLDEYGRGPMMLLHRMNADGKTICQISFNMSHDFDPMVTSGGAILFGRWLNMPGAHLFPLFSVGPDGRGMFSAYIDRSDFSHRLAHPVEMPDGRIVAVAIKRGNPLGAGKLTILDPRSAIEPGQTSATRTEIPTERLIFRTAGVLPSGELLVSCCSSDDPRKDFGLWSMEANGSNRKLVYNDPLLWDEGAVAVVPRPRPPALPPSEERTAESAVVGVLNVYDNTGVRATLRCERDLIHRNGSVRNIRVVEGLPRLANAGESLASIRAAILGRDRWRILGQAHVAGDGSILIDVPARRPIRFQTLGDRGRVQTEEMNWFYAMPGETRLCIGCHSPVNNTPSSQAASAMGRKAIAVRLTGNGMTIGPPQETSRARSDDCGECHGGIFIKRWERNAHATSHVNPRFLNFYEGTDAKGNRQVEPGYKLDFPKTQGVCASCHAPNAALGNPWGVNPSEIADKTTGGVHCVICHRASSVDLTDLGSRPGITGMEIREPGMVGHFFMGPYDDVHSARDVHMPLHARSELCAPCHEAKFWGTSVYATYSEYLSTPEAKKGIRCQDCHLPSEGFLPDLSQERLPPIAPVHENREHEDALLRQSAAIGLEATRRANGLCVSVSVTNQLGGHHLPTGHDMRNIVLVVSAEADERPLKQTAGERIPAWGGEGEPSEGNYAGSPGKIFAKVLCDELENFPAPSWRRCTILSDNRIPAHNTDRSAYEFEAPADNAIFRVRARLIYRRFFKPFISAKEWDLPDVIIGEKEVVVRP